MNRLAFRREALLRMQSSTASMLHPSPLVRQSSSQLQDKNDGDNEVERPNSTISIQEDATLSQRTMRMSTRGLSSKEGSFKSRISLSTRGLSLENDDIKSGIRMSTRGLSVENECKSLDTPAMNQEESCPIPKFISFETPVPETMAEEVDAPAPVDVIVIYQPIEDAPKQPPQPSAVRSSRKPPLSSSTASMATAELTLSSSTGSTPAEKESSKTKKKKCWFQKFSFNSSTAFQSSKCSLKHSESEKTSRRFSLSQLSRRSSSALVA